MSKIPAHRQNVQHLSNHISTHVSDDLNKILTIITSFCPEDAIVILDFDGRLRVHIDVRSFEDMLRIEETLPNLGGGMFLDISRGETPLRPFHHRLTAVVNR